MIGEGLICGLLKWTPIGLPCFFKSTIHIPCPGCGLTRAIREIFQFHFGKALYYNYLSIPIVHFLILLNYFMLFDIIEDQNRAKIFLKRVFSHPSILFLLLLVSWGLNLYHDI